MDSIFITPEVEAQELVAQFVITGEPISKARARFTNYGSKVRAYTPKKTLDGQEAVKAAFLKATRKINTDPEAAYAVRAHFCNGTRQRRDVDNMVKLLLDGLNGAAWVDDNQVLEIAARKSFGTKSEARTEVQIFRIGDMDFPKKPCIECGEEFRTYDSWNKPIGGKKYCSRACFDNRVQELRERECAYCGDSFTADKGTSSAKYCSRECGYQDRRTVTNCAICNKEFSIQRCHVKVRNYCSKSCVREMDRRAHKERRSKYFPGTCGICGGGTTRKEYKRCNPCKKRGAIGKPQATVSVRPLNPRT